MNGDAFTPSPEGQGQSPRKALAVLGNVLGIPFFLVLNAVIFSILIVQILYMPNMRDRLVDVQPHRTAIILGASVLRDGTPSDALRDRILSGVDLYNAGLVEELLMTGDDGAFHIDEISSMKETAMRAGVPEQKILTDGHGYRTYESCKRAIEVYGVSDAIVVTQRFHLGRALFLCNELGVDAIGFVADRQTYIRSRYFWIRDLASSAKAFYDVYIQPPKPPVSWTGGS
ncbi:YdcF family protein [candidate division WWE3 bacterium]|jgi:vancomycin permeability regulator SanA|uniref:YdcF family protein n=1 Tax=candidate division WWE3 bacterium TaxID=2053526 RepID=A0A928Y4G6_UNCKA|nr:YdcF family protein [candidate division WWE3 bacterium]